MADAKPLYRVLRPLTAGHHGTIPAGVLSPLDWLNELGIAQLVEVGAVAPVAAPPLTVLPGWQRRADKLRAVGVVTLTDFLQADEAALLAALNVKAETIYRWRQEARAWLAPPAAPRNG